MNFKLAAIIVFLSFTFALVGCGGGGTGGSDSGGVTITISPAVVNVATRSTQEFTAVVTGTSDTRVLWSIREGAAGGTIVPKSGDSRIAVYTAPDVWNRFHVIATSVADPSKIATAEVRVGPPLPSDL